MDSSYLKYGIINTWVERKSKAHKENEMTTSQVSQEAANEILRAIIKDRVQNGLNGVFQGIGEMTAKVGEESSRTRQVMLEMVEATFAEIMEEQKRRVRVR